MVLARKYRPRGFDSMVGQGHVVQALGNALTQQRLHHAYLFTGTRGVGKTTVSRILAKSLNCVGPEGNGTITASPCGQCQHCRDIDAGRFVDYVELDAASNRGVEEISQLLEQAVYKPVVGRFKVYMIDEVHMLSNTAFNAMLKTLEEPPDYLKFVLATTDPQKVPVTVLSRCLQFNLRPMAAETVLQHLQHVLGIEGIGFDVGALRLLSRAARGSMRDAMSLADQAIAFGGGQLEEGAVRQMLGSVDRQHVQRIVEAVAANDGAGLVASVDALRHAGLSASGTLEELATALQRMAVLQAVPQALDSEDPDAAIWQGLAPLLAPDETQLFYSLCLQGRAELALAPDEYSGLLMLLLRLLAFKPGQGASPPKAPGPAAPREAAGPAGSRGVSVAPVTRPVPSAPVSAPVAPVGTVPPVVAHSAAPVPQAPPVVAQPPVPSPAAHAAPPVPPVASPTEPARRAAPPQQVAPPARSQASSSEAPPWDDIPPGEPDGWADNEPPMPMDEMVSSSRPGEQDEPAWADSEPTAAQAPAVRAVSLSLPAPGEDPLGERWGALVNELNAKGLVTALVRELAMQAQCLAQSDQGGESHWRLQVERENLRSDALRERLSQAMGQVLAVPVVLEIGAGKAFNTPAQREQVAREQRQFAAEDLIQGDPLVQSLLATFPGARIAHGSIKVV